MKTLFIAALLLFNAFFLAIIIMNSVDAAAENRRAAAALLAAFEHAGISVECDLRAGDTPRVYRTVRDTQAERRIAEAALGNCGPPAAVSWGTRYDSENGSAQFNALGNFLIEFTDGVASAENAGDTARQYLRLMRIGTGDITVHTDGNIETASAAILHNDAPVVNCSVEFHFEGGTLLRISGRRASGAAESSAGERAPHDLPTLLSSLLASVKRGEISCNTVRSVEPAYRLTTVATGEGELVPGWLIGTDTAAWFADALTGRLESTGNEYL